MENKILISKLRIYAMLMRIQELKAEKELNDYYKRESLSVMKITNPYVHEQLSYLDEKSGREHRRERREKERKLNKYRKR